MDTPIEPELTAIHSLHGVSVLCYAGEVLARADDVLDALIPAVYGTGVEWVAIPVSRLAPEFFDLSTRVAGEMLQKLLNYQLKVAVVGPIDSPSAALADFVRESNRGRQVWFVADLAELERRL